MIITNVDCVLHSSRHRASMSFLRPQTLQVILPNGLGCRRPRNWNSGITAKTSNTTARRDSTAVSGKRHTILSSHILSEPDCGGRSSHILGSIPHSTIRRKHVPAVSQYNQHNNVRGPEQPDHTCIRPSPHPLIPCCSRIP